jgi:hypothetical protein
MGSGRSHSKQKSWRRSFSEKAVNCSLDLADVEADVAASERFNTDKSFSLA